MRVLFTGGGTGGHLYPALAVAELLQKSESDCEILFVGTGEGLESKVVPGAGYSFRQIAAGKWPRNFSFKALRDLGSLGKGYLQGIGMLKEFRPHAVFATGGYVSVPIGLAAASLRVPLFLHEQNSVPGMANKLLSRWAEVTFTTFQTDKEFFPSRAKLVHSGLPIRGKILNADRMEGFRYFGLEPDAVTVLVTGGSRGARRINQVMLEVYREICQGNIALSPLQVIHLTGAKEYQRYCQEMEHMGIYSHDIGKLIIKPYLEEMEYALAIADLVISRAGAATLAEVTALGIPGILIPYPFATGDHQYHNARYLESQDAAVLIPEEELTPVCLLREMVRLVDDSRLRQKMSEKSRQIGRPEAGELIAGILLNVGKKSLCTSTAGNT
ncbi:MAG TPA: undecaprenyldiphospho-muramoylpentapeptide beta-N-acetylglucosaminyltransferase [Syntrophomonadaceae bacterium]|nr:undecaprenyldiphospho-muramoylpentapeptide beta-N-acetylglucosaminyltransferase [Syntrophomonadaceae bacterium]